MKNLRLDHYLLLKYCSGQCISLPPTWAKSLTKFNPKMQHFKRVFDLIASKRKIEQSNFSIGLQMFKI